MKVFHEIFLLPPLYIYLTSNHKINQGKCCWWTLIWIQYTWCTKSVFKEASFTSGINIASLRTDFIYYVHWIHINVHQQHISWFILWFDVKTAVIKIFHGILSSSSTIWNKKIYITENVLKGTAIHNTTRPN